MTAAQTFKELTREFGGGVLDSYGNSWSARASSGGQRDHILRTTPDGTITRFPIPTENADPFSLALGADGNIWFTERDGSKIGRITPEGEITEFELPVRSQPIGIATGGDGNMWFTTRGTRKVGRITPAGAVTLFSIPKNPDPWGIVTGPDGNLYFAVYGENAIGKVTPAGEVSLVTLTSATPVPCCTSFRITNARSLTLGPDGNFWTVEETSNANKIYRISPAGVATGFTLPTPGVQDITVGIDGNIWVLSQDLLRITPAGEITTFDPPGDPRSIKRAADGSLWMAAYEFIDNYRTLRMSLAGSGLHAGTVFSSAQSGSQSFLRFWNTSTAAGTVTVTLSGSTTGLALGTWTSGVIPAGAELQYSIAELESALGAGDRPAFYTISVAAQFSGYFQHVLWRAADGTLTNLSSCRTGTGTARRQVAGVHSSRLAGYDSSVVVSNARPLAASFRLGVYDARSGAKLGTAPLTLPANGQITLSAAQLEAAAGFAPSPEMLHYVVKAEGVFWGHLQHTLFNQSAGVLTDMTIACYLDPQSEPQRDDFMGVTLPGPATWINELAAAPDGNIWAATDEPTQLLRISPEGAATAFALPTYTPNVRANNLAVDSGGNAWVVRLNTLAKATPLGSLSSHDANAAWSTIAAAGDGAIWYALPDGVARRAPNGETARFTSSTAIAGVDDLAGAADGSLWYSNASSFSSTLGRISPAGVVTQFGFNGGNSPQNLSVTPDGSLWYINSSSSINLHRVTPTGEHIIVDDSAATSTSLSAGPEGGVWIARQDRASGWRLGRFESNGSLQFFSLPSDTMSIHETVVGADGNVWYVDGPSNPRVAMRYAPADHLRIGSVFAPQSDGAESFLRLSNEGTKSGNVRLIAYEPSSGRAIGQWSTEILPGTSKQIPVSEIETGIAPADRAARYSIAVDTSMVGRLQHILWRRTDGTLTNLSTCDEGIDSYARTLIGVHSSLFSAGFPSTLAVFNAGPTSAAIRLGIFNAATGVRLGTFSTASIPPNAQSITEISAIESQSGIDPKQGVFHYIVKAESAFSGFIQHTVENKAAGVVTDMTTSCLLR